jgi:predicted transcriptional regulator
MTIRKNFLLDEEIVEHLKEIAKANNTTQTQVIRNMIEEQYQEIAVKEKLEAINSFAGSGNGLYGELTIQEIKAQMDV